jgi:hypothetical protein
MCRQVAQESYEEELQRQLALNADAEISLVAKHSERVLERLLLQTLVTFVSNEMEFILLRKSLTFLLDEMILKILIAKITNIEHVQSEVVSNIPLRMLHRAITEDIGSKYLLSKVTLELEHVNVEVDLEDARENEEDDT